MELLIIIVPFCIFAAKWGRNNPGVIIALMAGGQQLIKFFIAMVAPVGRANLAGQIGLFFTMISVGIVLFISSNIPSRIKKIFSQKCMVLPVLLCVWLLI